MQSFTEKMVLQFFQRWNSIRYCYLHQKTPRKIAEIWAFIFFVISQTNINPNFLLVDKFGSIFAWWHDKKVTFWLNTSFDKKLPILFVMHHTVSKAHCHTWRNHSSFIKVYFYQILTLCEWRNKKSHIRFHFINSRA